MVRDPHDLLEVIYVMQTSRLPKPMYEYDPITLLALLQDRKIAIEETEVIRAELMSQKHHWTADPEPVKVTGDPLVDKWEREIATGKTPDLDEEYNG